jgi:hypothetical protein
METPVAVPQAPVDIAETPVDIPVPTKVKKPRTEAQLAVLVKARLKATESIKKRVANKKEKVDITEVKPEIIEKIEPEVKPEINEKIEPEIVIDTVRPIIKRFSYIDGMYIFN